MTEIPLGRRAELHEQSSMTNWWPRLQSLDVPTPKTVEVGMEEVERDDGAPATDGTVMVSIADKQEVATAVEEVGGPPAFLRSDQMSAKHRMEGGSKLETASSEKLVSNIWRLWEMHRMAMGAPDARTYYVREWLDLYHEYTAFTGTPIAAEIRYFIYENDIYDFGFYWPKDAIRRPDTENWAQLHEKLRVVAFSYQQRADRYALQVAEEFDGYWSVDFALTEDFEYYCIDMAKGEVSWHPDGCTKPEDD